MQTIQLLVFDIDGTLVPRNSKIITPSAKEAIQACCAKGIKVLVATGRCWYFILPDVIHSLHSDYYVTINGQCLIDKNFQILQAHTLSIEEMKHLTDICIAQDVSLGFKFKEALVTYNGYEPFVTTYTKGVEYPEILFDDPTRSYHLTHGNAMGAFLIGEQSRLEAIEKAVPELAWVNAYANAKEAFRPEYNKATAVEEVLKLSHLSWDNVMAFGDADNDVEMITKAKIGVAMGNACLLAKQAADYVTGDCDKDGIKEALQQYGLLDKIN